MKKIVVVSIAAAAVSLGACMKKESTTAAKPAATATPAAAAAQKIGGAFEAKSGSKLTGDVEVSTVGGKVMATVNVANVTPGKHGVHVHQNGDCSAPDASSAGGHFNPGNMKHGSPTSDPHHAGDLGNMTVGADGKGTLTIAVPVTNADELVGKAVVVHEKEDDLKTDPAGNSGARIGCAVLKKM